MSATTAVPLTDSSTDTPCPPEVERHVTTVSVTSETTNSNSVLPNTASNDIQQHVDSANSGDVQGLGGEGLAGTSVRSLESQEGVCESLKGPIALDSGRFSRDLG